MILWNRPSGGAAFRAEDVRAVLAWTQEVRGRTRSHYDG